MLRKEWPLIMYTLIIQLAAGLFMFLAVYSLFLKYRSGNETAMIITASGMTFVGPVILLGIFLSLFHLGNPFRAYKSVNNIGSSWLSREVFFTGGFFGLWFLSYIAGRIGISNTIFVWLTAAVGILTVLSMSWIYFSTEKPGWYSLNTFTAFFGTMIIFGVIGAASIIALSGFSAGSSREILLFSLILGLVVLLLRFLHQLILISKLKSLKDVRSMDNLVSSAPSMSEIIPVYKTLTYSGLLMSSAGVILVLFYVSAGTGRAIPVVIAAAVLVTAGELMIRSGFYSLGLAKDAE